MLLPEWLRFTEGFYLMGYALLVIILMAFCPTGLLGLADRLLKPRSKTATETAAGPDAAMQTEVAR